MITINEVRSELRRAVEYGEGLRNAGPEHDRALECARRTLEIVEEYEKLVRRVLNLQVPSGMPKYVYEQCDLGILGDVADLQREYRRKI